MAERLARLFGTEQDRVNCPFYAKMGACRHGDRCSRLHHKPSFSPTLLLANMYQNPMAQGAAALNIDEKLLRDHFEEFYEDVFEEFSQFGKIDDMHVMDNLSDQLVGNVYCMFDDEEGAAKALTALNGRFYAGRPIMAEFSPVTDFHESRCRQFDEAVCSRGGQCNFMHIKKLSSGLCRRLKIEMPTTGRPKGYDDRGGDGGKGGGGYGGGGGGYGGGYDDRGGRDRDRGHDRHDERRSDERRSSRRDGGERGERRREERRREERRRDRSPRPEGDRPPGDGPPPSGPPADHPPPGPDGHQDAPPPQY